MKKLIVICCMFFALSCDTYDSIDLVNQCDSEIVCDYGLDTIPVFPSINRTAFYLKNSIKKGEADRFTRFGSDGWERFIDGKSLSIFIYQTDSLRKYGNIDSLKARKLYKRLNYSVVDLEKLDYTINLCF